MISQRNEQHHEACAHDEPDWWQRNASKSLLLALTETDRVDRMADVLAVLGGPELATIVSPNKPIDYEGASGPCDYDAHGDVVTQLARFQVRGSRFADVDRFDCTREPSCPQVRLVGGR